MDNISSSSALFVQRSMLRPRLWSEEVCPSWDQQARNPPSSVYHLLLNFDNPLETVCALQTNNSQITVKSIIVGQTA